MPKPTDRVSFRFLSYKAEKESGTHAMKATKAISRRVLMIDSHRGKMRFRRKCKSKSGVVSRADW